MSPYAGPGEMKYPDEELAEVEVSDDAKALALDLHNEARLERVLAIIQIHLDKYHNAQILRSITARAAVTEDA